MLRDQMTRLASLSPTREYLTERERLIEILRSWTTIQDQFAMPSVGHRNVSCRNPQRLDRCTNRAICDSSGGGGYVTDGGKPTTMKNALVVGARMVLNF